MQKTTTPQNQVCNLCYEQEKYFILPPCDHKAICWKCGLKVLEGSIFTCPICKHAPQDKSVMLFVDFEQLKEFKHKQILEKRPYKSKKNTIYFYSNETVASFIQQNTSFNCKECNSSFETLNQLKKHLNESHRRMYCDVCLDHRKCLVSEQKLYNQVQLNQHLKKGQFMDGQRTLYHPQCRFCKQRYYDMDGFNFHFRQNHQQCHICKKNPDRFAKYKYVYYKNYEQMEKHFQKTHFMCNHAQCVTRKFENVYISQEKLDEHILNTHKKKGKAEKKQVLNMELFHGKNNEDVQQWDKVGDSYHTQFLMFQKHINLQVQDHKDQVIDVRYFYQQRWFSTKNQTLKTIAQNFKKEYYPNDKKILFSNIPLYQPFQMESCTRIQLQKFIIQIYQEKTGSFINNLFFTRRNQFHNFKEFFNEIKKIMQKYYPKAYYYAFPQLIRFMKTQNPAKQPMDVFYYQSLRQLEVNKEFIFHHFNRYSEIIQFIKDLVIQIANQLFKDEKINTDLYIEFLKKRSLTFYCDNQQHFFFVPRQKKRIIYHMLSKSKTRDFLKMNSLLKHGFSRDSYDLITKKFYFKTKSDCKPFIQKLTIKDLALLYCYLQGCLYAFFDKETFQNNKKEPKQTYLSHVINKQTLPLRSSLRRQIQHLENTFQAEEEAEIKKRRAMNNSFNEEDYPTLMVIDTPDQTNTKKEEKKQLTVNFGKQRTLFNWNQQNSDIKVNKNRNVKKQQQQFPSLGVQKANKKKIEVKTFDEDQQDFPVFDFKEKKKQKMKPQVSLGFNKKLVDRKWDEDHEIKKLKTKPEKEDKTKKVNSSFSQSLNLNSSKSKSYQITNFDDDDNDNDDQLQRAINESKKSYQIEQLVKKQPIDQPIEKKNKKNKKKNNKNNQQKQQKNNKNNQQKQQKNKQKILPVKNKAQIQEMDEDFPEVQIKRLKNDTSEIMYYDQPAPSKNRRARLDLTDSSQEQRRVKEQEQKQEKQKAQLKKQKMIDEDDFEPLVASTDKKSVINKLIQQGAKEKEQPTKFVKKNRKGKTQVIQTFKLSDLHQ